MLKMNTSNVTGKSYRRSDIRDIHRDLRVLQHRQDLGMEFLMISN